MTTNDGRTPAEAGAEVAPELTPDDSAILDRARAAGWKSDELAALRRRLHLDASGTLSHAARAALAAGVDSLGPPGGPTPPAGAPGAPRAPQAGLGTLDDLYRAGDFRVVDLTPYGYGVTFRVRPLSLAELTEAAAAFATVAQGMGEFLNAAMSASGPLAGADAPGLDAAAEPDDDLDPAAEPETTPEDVLARLAGLDPRAIRQGGDLQGKIVCASVRASSRDGGQTWEPIQVVPRQEAQDPARNRLWWGALNAGAVSAIFAAAMSRTQEGADRARTFRR